MHASRHHTCRTALNATSNRIISFDLDFASPHSFTVFRVQCFGEVGDSYALLGGNRIDDPASTASSFKCEIVSTTKLRLTAFYPGQRSTEQHVYLRCSQQNNGIETAVLSDATGGCGSGYGVQVIIIKWYKRSWCE